MKIAVIVKTAVTDDKVYTTHRDKVTYHTDGLFLSKTDKNAIEYALSWIKVNGGSIDAYTFEKGVLADRVLHEALAMGADTATKFTGADVDDPLQGNKISQQFVDYLKENNKDYDLILTGYNENSDVLSASIAQKLNYSYYDHISKADNKFNYETKLEKGNIRGQYTLPAVMSMLDTVNTPHLPSFVKLHDVLISKINEVKLSGLENSESQIVADQRKHKKVILDMNQDPNAIQELVDLLKHDGILK